MEKKTKENLETNGKRDYSHLPRARDFKLPKIISPELKELMEQVGFDRVEYFNLTAGIVALHRGYKF